MYSRIAFRIIALYASKPGALLSKADMHAAVPCVSRSIHYAVKVLTTGTSRCLRVAAWSRGKTVAGRDYIRPLYAFGNKPDVAKPKPRSKSWYRQQEKLAREKGRAS